MTILTFEEGEHALTKHHTGRQTGGKKTIEATHEQLMEEVAARRATQDKPSIEVMQNMLESANSTTYMMEYDRVGGLKDIGKQRIGKFRDTMKLNEDAYEAHTISKAAYTRRTHAWEESVKQADQQAQPYATLQHRLNASVTLSVGGIVAPKQRSKHSALSQRHAMYN